MEFPEPEYIDSVPEFIDLFFAFYCSAAALPSMAR